MRLPLPRSLFARLMLIWMIGIALVLAVSLALFVGERERIGRSALFEGVAQEIATAADLLSACRRRARTLDRRDRPPPPAPGIAPAARPPAPARRRPSTAGGAARGDARARRPPLYTHLRHDRPHPGLLIVVALADGTPLQVRLPGIPPQPPIMPREPGRFLAALAALVAGCRLAHLGRGAHRHPPAVAHGRGCARARRGPGRAPMDARGPTEVAQAAAAFNQMQQRIAEHVTERTRILAAISTTCRPRSPACACAPKLVDDEALLADPVRPRGQAGAGEGRPGLRRGAWTNAALRKRSSSGPHQQERRSTARHGWRARVAQVARPRHRQLSRCCAGRCGACHREPA